MREARPTVLIVDDNPEDRSIYRQYLDEAYAIQEAAYGAQALALCRTLQPACLVLDYRLPDGDGLTWLARLQEGAMAPPVILLTGAGNEALAVEAMKRGAQDYLVKQQLTPELLRRAVQHAIAAAAQHDLTARRQIEAQLRESEQRLTLALEAAAMGVWDWNLHTQCVTWSSELYQIFGVEAFDGTPESFGRFLHPEDADRVWATVTGAIRDHALYEAEFRIIRGDGAVRWIANRGRAEYDASGQPVRMLGIAMDVTARKETEEALRRIHDSLTLAQ